MKAALMSEPTPRREPSFISRATLSNRPASLALQLIEESTCGASLGVAARVVVHSADDLIISSSGGRPIRGRENVATYSGERTREAPSRRARSLIRLGLFAHARISPAARSAP
jgi:hypothetical protein